MIAIESAKNPLIKRLVSLSKRRERLKLGQFTVEGIREVQHALNAGLQPIEVCYNGHWASDRLEAFSNGVQHAQQYQVSDEAFERISYRSGVPNVVASFPLLPAGLANLNLKSDALVVVLEGIEKPGNLGAIFRTADAAGIDAIIVANPNGDLFNPNVIRASLGTLFTVPFAVTTNDEALDFLNQHAFSIYATYLDATTPHYAVDMTGNTALVLGSEAHGITEFWIEHNTQAIKIPMLGQADSLNVSTATAITIYEAIRQRA